MEPERPSVRIHLYLGDVYKRQVYDMCKAVDRGMEIADVRLLKKDGGKTGLWER